MLGLIKKQAPSTWSGSATFKCEVSTYTDEFKEVEAEIRQAVGSLLIRRVTRIEDVYAYGQFLVREQLLLNCGLNQLYRVRRFIAMRRAYFDDIIKYNLDPRRCGGLGSLQLQKNVTAVAGDLIVVVKVLTNTPNQNVIEPQSSSEYFVEYIIDLQ